MSFWIMKTFNPLFFATFAFFVALLAVSALLLKNRSERTRQIVLVAACAVTFIGYFVYKYFLSIDAEYDGIIQGTRGGFSWWGELPLHLCNINMMLIPIAVLTKNRPLMSFCFFLAPLGALLAIILPGEGFSGYSIFLPRMLGYYGTHFMIVIEGLALAAYGFYRPKFRDLPKTFLTMVILMLVIFGVNLFIIHVVKYPAANYFYTMFPENISLLELFWKWIPVPCLYLLPGAVILVAYMSLVTGGFWLADRLRKKKV